MAINAKKSIAWDQGKQKTGWNRKYICERWSFPPQTTSQLASLAHFFSHTPISPFSPQCGAWSQQARKSIRLQLPDRARSSVLPLQTVNGLFKEGFAIHHLVQHDWRAIVWSARSWSKKIQANNDISKEVCRASWPSHSVIKYLRRSEL